MLKYEKKCPQDQLQGCAICVVIQSCSVSRSVVSDSLRPDVL